MQKYAGRHPSANGSVLCGSALAATIVFSAFTALPAAAQEVELEPIELLGKFFFFDERLSTPRNKQSCASCHEPAVGWTLPLSDINATTVGAPGARPDAQGGRRPQNNSYVKDFLGEYTPATGPFAIGPVTTGGAFWDGRAEGCGASTGDPTCQVGSTGNFSVTITAADLPPGSPHTVHLGAVADQALNPTTRPGVEQNTRVKNVCNLVKTGPYADLYEEAFDEAIDCSPNANEISFKRLAVSVAAWQGSPDVNSFSSPRDACISGAADADGVFPCDNLSAEANLGHDLFYGRNDTGLNDPIVNAGCAGCHNNKGPGSDGNEEDQVYADFAYHSIALPFNPDLIRNSVGADPGLLAHDDLPGNFLGLGDGGMYKTPTLRNVTKNELGITKAFMHNGYFKTIEDVVHFYNTRFVKVACEGLGIEQATAEEAIANDCWPVSEFPDTEVILPGLLGQLGLDADQEAALVAYIRSLDDSHTPTAPNFSRNPNNS
jgi:cytochrome c peroxidase